MKITLEPKWVYGRHLFYPRCVLSEGLARLGNSRAVKQHSFTQYEVDLMKSIGIKVEFMASDPKRVKSS
jgi:hypothetical protein